MPKVANDASAMERIALLKQKFTPARIAQAFEREALLVFFSGMALYHWTALGSFSPLDASLTTAVFPEVTPVNLAGTYGAHLSSATIYLCGLIAWILPFPLLTVAFAIFKKRDDSLAFTRLLGWVLFIVCASVAASLAKPTLRLNGFDFPTGGQIGTTMGGLLRQSLGLTGGTIVLCTLGLMSLLWLLRRPMIEPALSMSQRLWAKGPKPKIPSLFFWKRKPSEKPLKTSEDPKSKNFTPAQTMAHPMESGLNQDGILGRTAPPFGAEERFDGPVIGLPRFEGNPKEVLPVQSSVPSFKAEPLTTPSISHSQSEIPEGDETTAKPYTPPPLSVFNRADGHPHQLSQHELETTSALLVKTFEDFGVLGQIIGYQSGPVVTVYEFQPDAGVKQSKVLSLIDDLALALRVDSIFIHPVRGKRALGVQVPNSKREPVHLGDILGTATFKDAPSPLSFGLGKTITGHPMCTDLTAMPHLLVAGATGSGKSVGINAMLCSIIMKATPEQVRMILVDPKMLELSIYEGIPHLLMPVITEPHKASLALKWAASEMERRYRLMQLACVRNIEGFNEFWSKSSADRRDQLREAMDDETLDRLPYILLVIDELADLMMTAPKDVEAQIQRLAQKARASGIHMVLATQRPSVDIITGVIKANLPCRIAYQVVSKHDSRTILDLIGAEKLLGKGDLLFQRPGVGRLERLQGALITDEEVLNLVASVKATSSVQYDEKIISWIDTEFARQKEGGESEDAACGSPEDEPKFNEAVAIGRAHGVVSASFLQRHLKIGYNRAARIVEFMESKGLVDKADGSKPRKWLGGNSGATPVQKSL
jgi:S-DNA-T family DNA segregation ATPase FtsK/SpoIIIE